jgi:hypothetical protein
MARDLVTFHTELTSLQTKKVLSGAGFSPRRQPVPRTLSASCGVCIVFETDQPAEDWISCLARDYAKLFEEIEGGYICHIENE